MHLAPGPRFLSPALPVSPHRVASARQLLLRRVALLEATLVQHGVAVPEASAATCAACAVDAADEEGRTALYVACWEGDLADARRLLGRGAAVDRAKQDGATPLLIACEEGHEAVVGLLLQHGAEVDRADEDGATPMYMACQEGPKCEIETSLWVSMVSMRPTNPRS